MSPGGNATRRPRRDNRARLSGILGLAVFSAAIYAVAASRGDLRDAVAVWLAMHALLVAAMLAGWRLVARGGAATARLALVAAVVFRVVAALGPEPSLSDDLYRYVWDGRVQAAGIHPYRHAPDAPELSGLRDDEIWPHINHPELRTIYPPVAQAGFAALARLGLGVRGFKLAASVLDVGVILALGSLLVRLGLPSHRIVLYAWNPLAVMEVSGSGHYEPAAVLLVVVAALWTLRGRPGGAAAALALGIYTKLLPAALLPGYVRRWRWPAIALFATVAVALALPLAWSGPAVGSGLFDYAERWERNGFLFPAMVGAWEWIDPTPALKELIAAAKNRLGEGALPWDWLYRHAWPPHLARATAGLLALAWVVGVSLRRGLDPARESFLALGGVLLLSPTFHPWYALWVLPFAAAFRSRGWLLLAALLPLAYLGADGDVPWWARALEFAPPLAWMGWDTVRGRRSGFASPKYS